MLCIMMLLAKARNDVTFAHYAVRRNIIHTVNITAGGNIICPQGQTSFSVNAQLRTSRYDARALLYKKEVGGGRRIQNSELGGADPES